MRMSMSKKDYIVIAEILSKYIQLERNNLNVTALSIAEDLADYFSSENPNFDFDKWWKACGEGSSYAH